MKHSIILKVGENLIYQFSDQPKPLPENSISTVEFNRALPEWEKTSKNYIVQKQDINDFQEFLNNDIISTIGVKVPYEDILIYADNLKNYAKYNKGGNNDGIKIAQKQIGNTTPEKVVREVLQQEKTELKKEHKFFIDVSIDDENGEPYIIFNNDAPINSMEHKIMKSFILKAKKDSGIEIKQLNDGQIKIVLC